ncbi:MAG: trypsin-like peptidase domain-containing protein [Flavisolibacter sp.]
MEERQYFILRGKEKDGPYTLKTLKEIGVNRNTKIWYPGLGKWTKASELTDLTQDLSIPPEESSYRKLVWPLVIILFLTAAGFTGYRLLAKPKAVLVGHSDNLSNQQLYKIYAPSVVLIQQRYMYEISAGTRKFYFNDYYSYSNGMGYLMGLTGDSLKAVDHAEQIEGTGFFVEEDGKILTNRHVAKPDPSEDEQYQIQKYLFESLDGSLASANFIDSVKRQNGQNDSLLAVLLKDSLTNAVNIASVRQKISEAEGMISEEEGGDEEEVKIDSASIDYLRNQKIYVKKITLELRAFLPGAKNTEEENGIDCKVLATSEMEDVDLALIQTSNKALPDSSIKLVDLTRIKKSENEDQQPQMSERLILIGYNRGTELAKTTEGIEAQLTEGKVSQNTDAFRLMYTIPTLPGSSGSPVFDDKGRLVSVNFAGMSQTQSFNYGIQPRQIKGFLIKNNISL